MTRKVNDATIKAYGSRWKHPALKAHNGNTVAVEPTLDDNHQTALVVHDHRGTVCTITSKGRT